MSEADSPNDQPDPASIEPSEPFPAAYVASGEVSKPNGEEGWQTVDFPGAISIDALPHGQALPSAQADTFSEAIGLGVIHYGSADLDPATPHFTLVPSADTTDAATQLEQLQQENATLRDRLAQAELDLVQHQIEWQLEAACSQTESTINEVAEMPRDRPQQLLQELERSQHTAQRQQILVETLTEQLESSQERIAQLERDCALTQQRHNEQVQQVLQAESTCRDLRLRLHRQQQQTLQFKAALEKCLEMPTIDSQQALPDASLEGSLTAPHPLSALLKPKNQPVKPWSQPSNMNQVDNDQPVMPKPLFRLLDHGGLEQSNADLYQEDAALTADSPFVGGNQERTIDASTDSSALLDSDDPQFVAHLMQLMFPDTAEEPLPPDAEALEADVSQAEAVFDLSPFLGVDHPLSTASLVEGAKQANASPEPLLNEQAILLPEDGAIAPEILQAAPPNRGGIPPLSTVLHPVPSTAIPLAASSDSVQPMNAWTWRDRLNNSNKAPLTPSVESASTNKMGTDETGTNETGTDETTVSEIDTASMAQRPSKLLALSTLNRRSEVTQTISVSSQPKLASASFATATPSPIVYPLRSSKKLTSLAAVDLPTFPKR
ncbi:MAG: hypothetical protein KME27_03190 [Lyngbya sp. HA4199-MV5]|nr:hypothetical protein [Lyngbya sp. HA4199-MV5]